MGKIIDALTSTFQEFIEQQKMFFVGTAGNDGRVNISPKGLDSLKVINPNRVLWLNLTGSGNETAAHLLEQNRMTIMFCSFEDKPLILRLYGTAKMYQPNDSEFPTLLTHFPNHLGPRQIFDMNITAVQPSCGYGVPLLSFEGDRTLMHDWAKQKGDDGIKKYWKDRNQLSIDGKPTGIVIGD